MAKANKETTILVAAVKEVSETTRTLTLTKDEAVMLKKLVGKVSPNEGQSRYGMTVKESKTVHEVHSALLNLQ